jgi:hypothetical protein
MQIASLVTEEWWLYNRTTVSFWSKAQRLVKYFVSASFLGLILGVLGLYYTLGSSRTNLVIDVAGESNVLDVRTSVKDLAVLFEGRDIQQDNSNLKILTVRLANQGQVNILETYFDSRTPWGLQIDGGRIIEARVTSSNSPYLGENLQPKISDANHVNFQKVIFDKGKSVTLELLVLHNKNIEPRVTAFGKVAGMDDIPVTNSFRDQEQQGFLKIAFEGPIAVQIARVISYFIVGLLAAIATGLAIAGCAGIVSNFKKKSRRRLVRFLPKEADPGREKRRQILLGMFIDGGLDELRRTRKILADKKLLRTMLSWAGVPRGSSPEAPPDITAKLDNEAEIIHFHPALVSHLEPLLAGGLLKINDESVLVDEPTVELLATLVTQLEGLSDEHDQMPTSGISAESSVKTKAIHDQRKV